jgi:DNA-binding SARP family transcriptional activator
VHRLTLSLLGPPRIERAGAPVAVDTRKAIALLAYLVLTRRRHGRDTLAALLWPDADHADARAALRRTLSALNRVGAGDALDIEREAVAVRPDAALGVDVEAFRTRLAACRAHGHPPAEVCARCLAPLAEAAALYRGDFLAGFSLRDSAPFDDWQFGQQEELRRELADALERLGRGQAARGDFAGAVGSLRRWLALDPLHEPAHQQLMRAHAWAGQHAAALRQYRECVRILDRELGVPPLEETTRLYEAIKEHRAPTPPAPLAPTTGPERALPPGSAAAQAGPPAAEHPAKGAATPPRYPLVGRSAELAALRRAHAEPGTDGRLIVLEGEAGIGKTRLAEESLAGARAAGGATLAMRCFPGEAGFAYGPFVAGLRDAVERAGGPERLRDLPAGWLVEAARLLPDLAAARPDLPPAPPLDDPGAQVRFFEGLRQTFSRLCAGDPPGVVFVDDLQWADSASLDLLAYLVRRLRDSPFHILAAWRGEEVPGGHRLRAMLAEAQRAGLARLVSLARLDRAAVAELARAAAAAGVPLPPDAGERMHEETEGLPYFLAEYLAALGRGEVATGERAWTLTGGVRDLLHARLAGVGETGRQVLAAAAVIGRSFDFDTLREASGRGEEEAVAALEALLAAGLVRELGVATAEASADYDFGHEKLRALVYEETSLARRRILHRRVAEALVARAAGRGGRDAGAAAGQIARHYQLAGRDAEAAGYFAQAGEHARRLFANAEALSHLETALALGHPEPGRLHEACGDARTLLGDYAAAVASYEAAAALRDPAADAVALARLERKLGGVHDRRGAWELAERHFASAEQLLGEGGAPGERAALAAEWSLAAHHRGDADRALALARRAWDLARAADDRRALARAHNLLGLVSGARGDAGQAREHLEQSLALAEALGEPGPRAAALNNLALACGAAGDVDRAVALAERALALCAAQGDRHREAALRNNLADLHHRAGRSEVAMGHLKHAVAIYAEIGVEGGTLRPEIWRLAEW